MNYLREQYENKLYGTCMSWLVHNKCDLDGFSGEKCPRCGCAKMRKNEEENPISLFVNIKICNSCAENEKILDRQKLDPVPFYMWDMNRKKEQRGY